MFLQSKDFNSEQDKTQEFTEKVQDVDNMTRIAKLQKDNKYMSNNINNTDNNENLDPFFQTKHKRRQEKLIHNNNDSQIDTQILEKILQNDTKSQKQQYEPGMQQQQEPDDSLPVLTSMPNKVETYQVKDIHGNNINNNEDKQIQNQSNNIEEDKNNNIDVIIDNENNLSNNIISQQSSSSLEEPHTVRESPQNQNQNKNNTNNFNLNNESIQSRGVIRFDDDDEEDQSQIQIHKTQEDFQDQLESTNKFLQKNPNIKNTQQQMQEIKEENKEQQLSSSSSIENSQNNEKQQQQNSDQNDDDEEDEEEEEEVVHNSKILQPNIQRISDLQFDNLKEFLTKPIPKGFILQCEMIRKKGIIVPSYQFSMGDGQIPLMKAKKKITVKNTYFYIYCFCPKTQKEYVVGKLKGKFFGSQFELFDDGENPKKIKSESQKPRNQLAVIICNIINQLKDFSIILPKVQECGQISEHKQEKNQQTLLKYYKNYRKLEKKQQKNTNNIASLTHINEEITEFTNQQPWYNPIKKSYELDFSERVVEPSIQNFALIDKIKRDEIYKEFNINLKNTLQNVNNSVNMTNKFIHYLQVGKQCNNKYNVDFQWPLTPLQAFAIAVANFNARWD